MNNNPLYAHKNHFRILLTLLGTLLIVDIAADGVLNPNNSPSNTNQQATLPKNVVSAKPITPPALETKHPHVYKEILKNGLTVLVRPLKTTQKVTIELFYGVGAKHEGQGEKGIAHLLEHMLFKGTDTLSETDIPLIAQKLNGHFNATTTYDHTSMMFKLPMQSWQAAFPLLADCMTNCTFKDELLNSELKVVVQELKMRGEDYPSYLLLKLLHSLFPGHPYQYPLIGYKHDLYDVRSQHLHAFYKKHYVPNNAVLVVVGNVIPSEVMTAAKKYFGSIPADQTYKQPTFRYNPDIRAQTITLYRPVKKPGVALVWRIPGLKKINSFVIDALSSILIDSPSAPLRKKLTETLNLVNNLEGFHCSLFEEDIFGIYFEPFSIESMPLIAQIVQDEVARISSKGCTKQELEAAQRYLQTELYKTIETTDRQARLIGTLYLAKRDENALYTGQVTDIKALNKKIQAFASNYLRLGLMYTGCILPLPEKENIHWQALQKESDEEDIRILADRTRSLPLEPGKQVHGIGRIGISQVPVYPAPCRFSLKNGLQVLCYQTDHVPKVECMLRLKANKYYEPESKLGLFDCLMRMIKEGGTLNRPAAAFKEALSKQGIDYTLDDGLLTTSCLSEDIPKTLALFYELLSQAALNPEALPIVKAQAEGDYHNFWQNNHKIALNLHKKSVFSGHPQGLSHHADPATLQALTHKDISDAYKNLVSHDGATLILVGDIGDTTRLKKQLNATFGQWKGLDIPDKIHPKAHHPKPYAEYHHLDRDQIHLSFGGPSIKRADPDFPALLLYSHLLITRLFALREKTGACYILDGSLVYGSDDQPGIIYLLTLVSPDRAQEVYKLLVDFITKDIDSLTEDDLATAQSAVLEAVNERHATNASIAAAFLTLGSCNLPDNYFASLLKSVQALKLDDLKKTVKKWFNAKTIGTVVVGRQNSIGKIV